VYFYCNADILSAKWFVLGFIKAILTYCFIPSSFARKMRALHLSNKAFLDILLFKQTLRLLVIFWF